jgi:hypothetical protein
MAVKAGCNALNDHASDQQVKQYLAKVRFQSAGLDSLYSIIERELPRILI